MNTTTSLRLFRVIVPVDDIERAARFYAELLQQPGTRISGGRHYFGCGGVILAVYCPAADGDRTTPRANFEHLYFATPDLEGVYQRAQALGGLVKAVGDGGLAMGEIAKRPWGERSFYMRDPFGNPLCFVDESSLFTGPRTDQGPRTWDGPGTPDGPGTRHQGPWTHLQADILVRKTISQGRAPVFETIAFLSTVGFFVIFVALFMANRAANQNESANK